MITQRLISRFSLRTGLFGQASRVFGPRSDHSAIGAPLCASENLVQSPTSLSQITRNSDGFSGFLDNFKGKTPLHDNVAAQFFGNLGTSLGFLKVKENVRPPLALSFSSFIHSAGPMEFETGRNSKSMNFVRGIMEENGKDFMGGSQRSQHGVEQNADIVHIKLIRNNTFITVTDSKGNKKAGASIGSTVKGGAKVSRYAAEATAEHVGRLARNMGLKSVVMKVNGCTYFKKKKQAILSFREGYTHSRGDQNPIVCIEDTTRRPHNGCRLRKKRRV